MESERLLFVFVGANRLLIGTVKSRRVQKTMDAVKMLKRRIDNLQSKRGCEANGYAELCK